MGDFFMNKDIELLDYIYQNAEMGVLGIDHVIEHICDENLAKVVETQKEELEATIKNLLAENEKLRKKLTEVTS